MRDKKPARIISSAAAKSYDNGHDKFILKFSMSVPSPQSSPASGESAARGAKPSKRFSQG
jgi:hypothetical protein